MEAIVYYCGDVREEGTENNIENENDNFDYFYNKAIETLNEKTLYDDDVKNKMENENETLVTENKNVIYLNFVLNVVYRNDLDLVNVVIVNDGYCYLEVTLEEVVVKDFCHSLFSKVKLGNRKERNGKKKKLVSFKILVSSCCCNVSIAFQVNFSRSNRRR